MKEMLIDVNFGCFVVKFFFFEQWKLVCFIIIIWGLFCSCYINWLVFMLRVQECLVLFCNMMLVKFFVEFLMFKIILFLMLILNIWRVLVSFSFFCDMQGIFLFFMCKVVVMGIFCFGLLRCLLLSFKILLVIIVCLVCLCELNNFCLIKRMFICFFFIFYFQM